MLACGAFRVKWWLARRARVYAGICTTEGAGVTLAGIAVRYGLLIAQNQRGRINNLDKIEFNPFFGHHRLVVPIKSRCLDSFVWHTTPLASVLPTSIWMWTSCSKFQKNECIMALWHNMIPPSSSVTARNITIKAWLLCRLLKEFKVGSICRWRRSELDSCTVFKVYRNGLIGVPDDIILELKPILIATSCCTKLRLLTPCFVTNFVILGGCQRIRDRHAHLQLTFVYR